MPNTWSTSRPRWKRRATVGWTVWFAANQQALSQQLSRPALLRLKFNQLDEAERLLAESGIVPASTAGKRYEMYCAQFALDYWMKTAGRGRPSGARRKAVPAGGTPNNTGSAGGVDASHSLPP